MPKSGPSIELNNKKKMLFLFHFVTNINIRVRKTNPHQPKLFKKKKSSEFGGGSKFSDLCKGIIIG